MTTPPPFDAFGFVPNAKAESAIHLSTKTGKIRKCRKCKRNKEIKMWRDPKSNRLLVHFPCKCQSTMREFRQASKGRNFEYLFNPQYERQLTRLP